jgi:hypothetical protein
LVPHLPSKQPETTMSLLDLLAEQLEPGPVGDFEMGPPPREPRPRRQVIVRGIVGLAMVAVPLVLASLATPFSLATATWVALGLELYLPVAYYVRPRPADFDRRWRAVLESPFRFTDDLNWMLWLMGVVLGPGRFASTAIVELVRKPSPPPAAA